MPDYKAMYVKLFQSQSKAISILQEAQKETEGIYIEAEPPKMVVLPIHPQNKADGKENEEGENFIDG